ncbi:MAG: hypothetical protein JW873_07290 [Candidatus Saganbacteria bacterium]|nr:hypothetical protein [Candidatus Saganbacteria bacterium]
MKYIQISQKLRSPVFTLQDLRQLGVKIFSYQLTLWQKQGRLLKLKNGVYAFADRAAEVRPETLAGLLYAPSYISLERALAVYGIIPEMVYGVTSVTPKTTRNFRNKIGHFIYRHIKPALFFGYRTAGGPGHKYLIAEPEKALLDLLYFNRSRLKSRADIAVFRFKRRLLRDELSKTKLKKYLKLFGDRRIKQALAWSLEKE